MKITPLNIKFSGTCKIDEDSYIDAQAEKNLNALKNALNDQYLKRVDKELLPTTKIEYKTNTDYSSYSKPGESEHATIFFIDRKGNTKTGIVIRNNFIEDKSRFIDMIKTLRAIFIKERLDKFVERVFKKAKALEEHEIFLRRLHNSK